MRHFLGTRQAPGIADSTDSYSAIGRLEGELFFIGSTGFGGLGANAVCRLDSGRIETRRHVIPRQARWS